MKKSCHIPENGKGLHVYIFTNWCYESAGLEMGDETTKIVLNAESTADDVRGRLMEFLNYMAGKPSDDEYIKNRTRPFAEPVRTKNGGASIWI